MPVATALAAIEHAATARVSAISFTGGEPLLDIDRLARLVSFASRQGIRYTRTGTNGFLFAGADTRRVADRAARVADKLSRAGLRNLWISLDSADPATHDDTLVALGSTLVFAVVAAVAMTSSPGWPRVRDSESEGLLRSPLK